MAQTFNSTIATDKAPTKITNILLWVAQIALAAMFIFAGFMKVSGNPMMIASFNAIGIGQWFRYFTGGLELITGVGLLIPRLAGISAAVLSVVMVGAIIAHLAMLGGSIGVPLALLVLSAVVAWGRSGSINALLGRK